MLALTARLTCRRRREQGFSLGEMLAVVAIMALATAVAVPLISEQVRAAKVRAAADQFAMSLKAARMIAVSKRTAIDVTVQADPVNSYSYTDTNGRLREIQLPSGVRIVSTTNPITFRLNGSLAAAASTVMEANMTGSTVDRWTVDTSILGISTISHYRVEN